MFCLTYSGLDMVTGALPFRRRVAAEAAVAVGGCRVTEAGGRGCAAACVTRCRLDLRVEVGASGSSSVGLVSG